MPDILLGQIGQNYIVPYMRSGNTDMAVLSAAKAVESVLTSPEHQLELKELQSYQPTFWNRHRDTLERAGYVLLLFAFAYGWVSLARKRTLKKYAIKTKGRYKGFAVWLGLAAFLMTLFLSLFAFMIFDVIEQVYQFKNLPYFAAVLGSWILMSHYYATRTFIKKSTKDTKTRLDLVSSFTRLSAIPLLLAPFAYNAYFNLGRDRKNAQLRQLPPSEAGNWTRINRDTLKRADLKNYLTDQQIKEEKLNAKSYEIWLDSETGKHHIAAFDGSQTDKYDVCPNCHGQTLGQPKTKVLTRATYTKTGTGESIQTCAFCDYKLSLGMVTIPKKRKSSSSSSGGSSGGGSSSSGSFGGGSSGGGGAGGRW